MASQINVTDISSTTTEQHLVDFFTFCGKMSSIDYNEKEHKATIAFEKASAAKTALMLNGGTLDGSILTVTSEAVLQDDHHSGDHPIEQSDKPRAGIAAEYLAKGYKLSDNILQKAIDMDKTHGISNRFLNYMRSLDKALGERMAGPQQTASAKLQATVEQASQQARTVDQQKGYSKAANDYYSKAMASSWGQQVKTFYTQTAKQVMDIHEEAKRIREQEKNSPPTTTTAPASKTE